MMETRIKCDGHNYRYSYERNDGVKLDEALAAGWYQITVGQCIISVSVPGRIEEFIEGKLHACNADHARKVVETEALKMIPDKEIEAAEPLKGVE